MKQLLQIAFALVVSAIVISSCKDKIPLPNNCGPQKAVFLKNGKQMMYWPVNGRALDTILSFVYTEVAPRVFRRTTKYMGFQPNTSLPPLTDTVVATNFLQCCGRDIAMQSIAYGIEKNFGSVKNYFVRGQRSPGDVWNYKVDSLNYYMGCAAVNLNYIDTPYLKKEIKVDKLFMKLSPANVPCDTILWNDSLGIVARANPVDPSKSLRLKWIR